MTKLISSHDMIDFGNPWWLEVICQSRLQAAMLMLYCLKL